MRFYIQFISKVFVNHQYFRCVLSRDDIRDVNIFLLFTKCVIELYLNSLMLHTYYACNPCICVTAPGLIPNVDAVSDTDSIEITWGEGVPDSCLDKIKVRM